MAITAPRQGVSQSAPGTRQRELATLGADSVLLQYLPGVYQRDSFMRRLLLIFESVIMPLERLVGTLPMYTEPEMAPEIFLPWLAHWVALTVDSNWPVDRQRALIANAVEIYRWRGTRQGLELHIASYTGVKPLIQEYHEGFMLGRDNGLGWNTLLGTSERHPLMFTVTVPIYSGKQTDEAVLRAIIEEDKPAHTTYRLRIAHVRTDPATSSPTRLARRAGPGGP